MSVLDPLLEALHEGRHVEAPTRMAVVTAVSVSGTTVQFDGEISASQRLYRAAAPCNVGDRVVMLRVGSTWVIAGPTATLPAGIYRPWTLANTGGSIFGAGYSTSWTQVGRMVHAHFKGVAIGGYDGSAIRINLPTPVAAPWRDVDMMFGTGAVHNPGIWRIQCTVGFAANGDGADGIQWWQTSVNNVTVTSNSPGNMDGNEIFTASVTYERA